jgi:hypothetical protein
MILAITDKEEARPVLTKLKEQAISGHADSQFVLRKLYLRACVLSMADREAGSIRSSSVRKRPKLCENKADGTLMAALKDPVLLSLLEMVANDGSWEAQLFMAEQCSEDEGQRDTWRSVAWETMTETTGSDSLFGSLLGGNNASLSASFLSSLVKAAEDDDHTAQLMLGRAYRTGVGKIVGKDTVKAFKYLQAAMAAGVEEANEEILKVSQDLIKEGKEAKEAEAWEKSYLYLKLAQEGGVDEALTCLNKLFSEFSWNSTLSLYLPRNLYSSLNIVDKIHLQLVSSASWLISI